MGEIELSYFSIRYNYINEQNVICILKKLVKCGCWKAGDRLENSNYVTLDEKLIARKAKLESSLWNFLNASFRYVNGTFQTE